MGVAEIDDDDKATTTTRASAEQKRIICGLCDMGSDNLTQKIVGRQLAFMCRILFLLRCALKQNWHICNASRLPAKVYGDLVWSYLVFQPSSTSWDLDDQRCRRKIASSDTAVRYEELPI
jgi:hypothetical protein